MLTLDEILPIIEESVQVGRTQEQIDSGKTKQFISQNEANKRFGRDSITRWRNARLIIPAKDGEGNHRMRYNLEQLQQLALSTNIHKLLIKDEINNVLSSSPL